jgi:hypothetical protein
MIGKDMPGKNDNRGYTGCMYILFKKEKVYNQSTEPYKSVWFKSISEKQ